MKYSLNLLSSFILPIQKILESLIRSGCTPYLVGGSVRDLVIGQELKDLDIELHGITFEATQTMLQQFGLVMLVGKQFGVIRIAGHDIDWSLPRRDSIGRKPEVAIDPFLSIEEACRRRDLTMNAMAINLKTFLANGSVEVIDPYGGLNDIQLRQLRAVDETLFIQDPLRFFRVMQFIGRFEMQPEAKLNALCASMLLKDPVTNSPLALERIVDEIKKLCLKSLRPSLGFRWLQSIKRLAELFPELAVLCETPQRPDFHPEGTVFEHTMQAIDAAARFKTSGLTTDANEHFLIMLATMCHDLGKATTTKDVLGIFKAHGHDEAGVPISATLLNRMTNDQKIIKSAGLIVRHHLAPFILVASSASAKAYKRLAKKLSPLVTMRQLGLVALADRQGRNGNGHEPLNQYSELFDAFLTECEKAAVTNGPELPALLGKHLLDAVPEGPELGKLLQKAYGIQIEEGITDPAILRSRVLKTKYE